MLLFFFFSSRRRHTRWTGDWSSDVWLFRSPAVPSAETPYRTVVRTARRRDGGVRVLDHWRRAGRVHRPGGEIGRASCGKECRSRWSPHPQKKNIVHTTRSVRQYTTDYSD